MSGHRFKVGDIVVVVSRTAMQMGNGELALVHPEGTVTRVMDRPNAYEVKVPGCSPQDYREDELWMPPRR